MFCRIDDFLGDLSGARLVDTQAPENALLVYADPTVFRSADDRLATLIKAVQQYGPSQIGVATAVSAEQLDRLASSELGDNVVFSPRALAQDQLCPLTRRQAG